MIDVKEAVKIAGDTLATLFSSEKLADFDLELEEVEISDDEKYWFITLGFSVPKAKSEKEDSPLSRMLTFKEREKEHIRKYKIFRIDAQTGKFHSMKIREV
jgi:hypothetical protein